MGTRYSARRRGRDRSSRKFTRRPQYHTPAATHPPPSLRHPFARKKKKHTAKKRRASSAGRHQIGDWHTAAVTKTANPAQNSNTAKLTERGYELVQITRHRFSFILSEKYSALAIGSDKFVATLACNISQAPGGADEKAQRILKYSLVAILLYSWGVGARLLLARKLPTRPLDPLPLRALRKTGLPILSDPFNSRLGGVLDVWPLQLGSSSQYPSNMQYTATHPLLCSALRSLLRSPTGYGPIRKRWSRWFISPNRGGG